MQHSAIFFDRDGTLNEDPGYLSNPSEVKLYHGTAEALAILKNELNFKLIVISNQSGIARGLITREIVESIHDRINELLIDSKVSIDAFYYCPFHPEYSTKEEASCRKPSPEMVLKAARENDIELSNSYFVGFPLKNLIFILLYNLYSKFSNLLNISLSNSLLSTISMISNLKLSLPYFLIAL